MKASTAKERTATSTATATRVLLVDDQYLMRAGIARLLTGVEEVEIVGEASDGLEAIREAERLQPDVVVMDVRMPNLDGVAATRHLTSDGFSPPDHPLKVLILTTYHVDDAVYAALRAGASGFLLKDAAPTQLVQAIGTVAAGDAWLDPTVARGLLREFAARPERQYPSPEELRELTNRERDVLVLAAYGKSNGEIAAHLFIGEATVKTHIGRVLMKLGLRDRVQAVVAAYQSGLVGAGTCPPPPGQGAN